MPVDITQDHFEAADDQHRSLVGRHTELRQLQDAIKRGARVLALSGPPGIGKTALARHFVRRHIEASGSERSLLVDGTGHEELAALIGQLGSRLGLELGATDSIREAASRLGTALEHREVAVVVFDRVGLIDSELETLVSALRRSNPELRMLLTAQKPPSLEVDVQMEVGPLETEQAVDLFCEWLPRTEFPDRTDGEFELIEELVERLDRSPLAIRLAASRYELMGGESLLERLEEGLDVLDPGGARQESRGLREAMAWAWEQLDASERTVLEQCSVFSGFFPLEAAESVVDLGEGAAAQTVVDVVDDLVRRSLLRTRRSTGGEEGRLLGLYRGMRNFAREKRTSPDVRRRHARWFTDCDPGLYANTDQIRALMFAQQDLETIVDRFSREASELALRALLILDLLYGEQGFERRHRRLVETGEQLIEQVEDPRLRARALWQFALDSVRWGEFERADDQLNDAYEIASTTDDHELATLILVRRSRCNWRRGKFEKAEEALELAERRYVDDELHPLARAEFHGFRGALYYNDRRPDPAADQFRRARDLLTRGGREARAALSEVWCAMTRAGVGALVESRERFTAAISTLRKLGAETNLVAALNEAAFDSTLVGEFETVIDRLEEALELSRKMGRRVMEGRSLNHLGIAYAERGQLQKARRFLDEARAILEEVDDYRFMSEALMEKAFVLLRLDDAERARKQLEKVTEIRDGFDTDVRWCIRAAQYSLAQNDSAEAYDRLEPATEVQGVHRLPILAARLNAWMAIVQWKRGRREAAETFAERARDRIGPVSECTVHGLVRAASRWAEKVDLREGDWEEWLDDRSVEQASIELRFLHDLYREHLAPADGNSETHASSRLDVGPDCRWFAPPGGERVELQQRTVLRNLLELLVRRRVEQPGQPVGIDELIEAGWPEQTLVESSGQNRVYVSISKLRKLGLDDHLLTGDKAYYLDPDVPIRQPFS